MHIESKVVYKLAINKSLNKSEKASLVSWPNSSTGMVLEEGDAPQVYFQRRLITKTRTPGG
jgi:hypothetical protein